MSKLKVNLKTRSYDVHVASGVIQKLGKLLPKKSKRAFIIADQSLSQARTATLESLKRSGWEATEFPVEAGEKLKNFENIYPLYGKLLQAGANRDSTLIALGGGTVGDAAGFIAATYLRGISWVGIPTTLLAQVDSALGGKCGINHELGKNLIGAIHQPKLVLCDTDFLKTLSERDMVSGFAEVVKTALIFDSKFYDFLEKNSQRFLARDSKVLTTAIHKTAEWKAKVVSKDEYDVLGIREVLNFGHTFGHALEAATSYGYFRHGEAVIWGMRFALALSELRKKISPPVRKKIDLFLSSLAVPSFPANLDVTKLFEKMSLDKKVRDGKLHFVLLKNIGKTLSDNKISSAELMKAYELMMQKETKVSN